MKHLALLSLFVAVGCGSSSTTVMTDDKGNEVKVSDDGTKMSFKNEKGETGTVETNAGGTELKMSGEKGDTHVATGTEVTEDDIGLPFYPGSTRNPSATMKASTPEGDSFQCGLKSPDVPSKVIEFYKPKLKDAQTAAMNDGTGDVQTVSGKLENGAKVGIVVRRTKDSNESEISITVVKEKKS